MRYLLFIIVIVACLTEITVRAQVTGKEGTRGLPYFEESFKSQETFKGTHTFSRTLMENGSLFHAAPDTCFQELQVYRTGNLSVDTSGSGTLVITARRELMPVKGLGNPYLPAEDTLCDGMANSRDFVFTSGRLVTVQRFPYGFFEARLQTPMAKGMWPAFWLHHSTGDCGTGKEIDIFEPAGRDSETGNTYGTNYHYSFRRDTLCMNGSQGKLISYGDTGYLSSGFHVYGLEWSPGKAVFYLDGEAVRTLRSKYLPSSPMNLYLNMAVDPWYPPEEDFSEAELRVDYIRVYTLGCDPSRSVRLRQNSLDRFQYKTFRSFTLKHLSVSSAMTLRATDFVLLKKDVEVEPGIEFCILPTRCF